MNAPIARRQLLRNAALAAAALGLPRSLIACVPAGYGAPASSPDLGRLARWVAALRSGAPDTATAPLGHAAVRVGELAAGSPYQAQTLEAYLVAGGSPADEPLTLSLTHFDCVTLVEACLAVARVADAEAAPTWDRFGQEVERMRYRGGERTGYASRLHYFSEWISDGERRGLLRDMGEELGGVEDARPLRFMTAHRNSYPALADDAAFRAIGAVEASLDRPRHVVPTARIADVAGRIESGDVLAFATSIEGLDVTHAAFAYRGKDAVLRVLHAPLSGGVVEVTSSTLPEYVAAIRRSTGILVARPLRTA